MAGAVRVHRNARLICWSRLVVPRFRMEGGKRQGYFVAPRGANECALRGRVCIGRKCRLAADTARDIFVGPRVGVSVSALGMRKITTTTTPPRPPWCFSGPPARLWVRTARPAGQGHQDQRSAAILTSCTASPGTGGTPRQAHSARHALLRATTLRPSSAAWQPSTPRQQAASDSLLPPTERSLRSGCAVCERAGRVL